MKATKIDTATLTPAQAQVRMNVRNFLLVATPEELEIELRISLDAGDSFRARCVEELIGQEKAELIKTGRQWLEHAPPSTESAPGLLGFVGALSVCSKCASRINGRGCNLKLLADSPVWEPATLACDLC